MFLDYLNPLSDNFILKKVIEFLVKIINYLNPFSENFFGYKIIELLGDLLEFLFVPPEERFTAITNVVESKFDFIDTIKEFITSLENIFNNLGNSPTLSVNIGSTKYTESQSINIIDLNWYKPFKPYGDLVLTGFIYIFFLWRLFITVPNIINSTGGSINSVYENIRGNKL